MTEVSFSFDDKLYKGHQGEPMSAALLRSGVLSITNSTYHSRPRGVIGLGVEEPNALVQLISDTMESMLPATVIEVGEGLAARSLTGVGALPELPDESRYGKTNCYVDTLVIGAGIAGLNAADEHLRAGREVLLIDDQPEPGGHPGTLTGITICLREIRLRMEISLICANALLLVYTIRIIS
jgi:sarcosine oxidase subunit alpha